jgi:hypothetical protein
MCREDATERLLDAACMTEAEWPGPLTRLKGWLTWRIIYAGNGETMQPTPGLQEPLCTMSAAYHRLCAGKQADTQSQE